MRILHVIADLERERGGPAQACIDLARLMARRGHAVRVVTSDRGWSPGFAEGLANRGAAPIFDAFPLDWPAFWGTSWAMRRRLASAVPEADVVHLHSLYLFHDWITGAYCRRFGTPYILRPHGTLDPYIYRRHRYRKALMELLFQRRVQRCAAGLHYTTEEERELARPYAHNPRGWVVPNGIDAGEFDDLPPREALRRRYPEIGACRVVLFFGRLNFKKGIDTGIAAFAAVARGRDDVFLVIAGPDGGQRALAERWVAEAEISERTLFTGMVTGADKRMVLAGADIFILPSLSENFGISVIEAAACGLPVIISDRVNLWPDFAKAEAGLIGPPTAEAFTKHLQTLLDNPTAAREMGRRGAALVRSRFTWDALGEQYEAMYREAAAMGGRDERARQRG
jgi:glycosyltransferase involved in cell wall biosynthesis